MILSTQKMMNKQKKQKGNNGTDEKILTPEQAKIREQYRKLLEEENIPQQ